MSLFEVLILLLAALAVVLNIVLLLRKTGNQDVGGILAIQEQLRQTQQQSQMSQERSERALREQVQLTAQTGRQELAGSFGQLQQNLAAQLTSVATMQNNQIDAFSQQLVKLNETNAQQLEQFRQAFILQGQVARDEQGQSLKRFGDSLNQTLLALTESNAQRMNEIRATLEQKIQQL